MPHYEVMCIVRPDVEKEVVDGSIDRLENLIRQQGGTVLDCEVLGRKRLAYEVKKFHEGIYVKLNFQAPPTSIDRLKGHMQLSEDIIRYLVVRTPTFIPTENVKVAGQGETRVRAAVEPTVPPDETAGKPAPAEPEMDAAMAAPGSAEPVEGPVGEDRPFDEDER